MSIEREKRTAAEMVIGAICFFVPDGTEYGDGKTADKNNVPTFEEALAAGLNLGMISTFKWNPEYKTVTKTGVNPETQRYETVDRKILTKVKPQFSTQDVTPEAMALEHGMVKLPELSATAQPFSNSSGVIRGNLYILLLDSYRTHGEDGEIAQIYLRGDLGLQDHTENNDDLKKVNYEFSVTRFPADGFKNIALDPALAN